MTEIRIDVASPSDAELLAGLADQTFREAFGGVLNPSDLIHYTAGAFTRNRIFSELSDNQCRYLIAFRGSDAPVGYAKLFAGETPDCVKRRPAIELNRFYTAKAWWGRGIGDLLMDACLRQASDNGYIAIWLATWQLNHRANAFYRRRRFEIVGEKTFVVGREVQEDFVMERLLQ